MGGVGTVRVGLGSGVLTGAGTDSVEMGVLASPVDTFMGRGATIGDFGINEAPVLFGA